MRHGGALMQSAPESLWCYTARMHDVRYDTALAFVRTHHTGVRSSGAPIWHHLARVSDVLESVLSVHGEGTADERFQVTLAALGHDLLEDTQVSEADVRRVFGDRGYELIWGMTNEQGDDDVTAYVKKVSEAEELVRLIKLADLFDNCSNVAYNMPSLGVSWVESFFLRVVTPMKEAVSKTSFETYRETARDLSAMVQHSYEVLLRETARTKATTTTN